MPDKATTAAGGDTATQEILADLFRVKCVFQGRAIAAAMGDMAAHGSGLLRITVDGIEHVPFAETRQCPHGEPLNHCADCVREHQEATR